MVYFGEIELDEKDFSNYDRLDLENARRASEISKRLKNKNIVHINSTENGGGVAEMLRVQVALEKDLGLNSHWYVIHPKEKFFTITKKIHNMLQGSGDYLTESEKQFYLWQSQEIGNEMDPFLARKNVDLIVTHDPQPLLIGCCNLSLRVPRILRLHVDLTNPKLEIVDFLKPFIEVFEKVIVSRNDYRPLYLEKSKVEVIAPAIDPLSKKNIRMLEAEAWGILGKLGVSKNKPLVSQVSRFDKFKDPVGVIKAYKIVKEDNPNLQLVLAGIIEAPDDPEAQEQLKTVEDNAGEDENIFIIYDKRQLGNITNEEFINATQSVSDVVLQKSLREGFGLTVAEAMWKKTPVIGGNVGGIKLQIENGENGFLVESVEEAAEKIKVLLKDKKLRETLGKKAKETVRKKFLMPRYILENLQVYSELVND